MQAMAQAVGMCDDWHEKYGTACIDEDLFPIFKNFLINTPALTLVDKDFLAKVPELMRFVKAQ